MSKLVKITKAAFSTSSILVSELRVGNTLFTQENVAITISTANMATILNNLSEYRAILLTESILIKSGFSKSANSKRYYIDKLDGYYLFFTGTIGILYKIDRGMIGSPIRYVHQLQNLWYVLTGKELPLANEHINKHYHSAS